MAIASLRSQPQAVTPDAELLAAHQRWQVGSIAKDTTVADAAEAELLAASPTTPEGIAALLWVALSHLEPDAGNASERGDLEWLQRNGEQLGWGSRFIISAIRALADMPIPQVFPPRVAPETGPSVLSELEARDRVALTLGFVRTLLTNCHDDFETALYTAPIAGSPHVGAGDAFNGLAMAQEYLAEVSRIEERPVARARTETGIKCNTPIGAKA